MGRNLGHIEAQGKNLQDAFVEELGGIAQDRRGVGAQQVVHLREKDCTQHAVREPGAHIGVRQDTKQEGVVADLVKQPRLHAIFVEANDAANRRGEPVVESEIVLFDKLDYKGGGGGVRRVDNTFGLVDKKSTYFLGARTHFFIDFLHDRDVGKCLGVVQIGLGRLDGLVSKNSSMELGD
jgi:hypothetical protein